MKQDPVVDEVLALRTENARLRAEVERLNRVVKAYEDDRIAKLGGIGSPA